MRDGQWPTRRPSAGYALRCAHAYRRGGYRLTPSGLRAPAHRERQPKPRALSGRGGRLSPGIPTIVGKARQCDGMREPVAGVGFKGFRFIGLPS